MYYIGKGAQEWEGFRGDPKIRGVQEDKGVCLIKSGTDFRGEQIMRGFGGC